MHTRGPVDLELAHRPVSSQPEMHLMLARSGITHRSSGVVPLFAGVRHDVNAGADSIAIAAVAVEPDPQPVTGGFGDIMQHQGRLVQPGHDDIDLSVAVEVAECSAAVQTPAGDSGVLKASIAAVGEDGERLARVEARSAFDIGESVAVGREQIFEAVVIEI